MSSFCSVYNVEHVTSLMSVITMNISFNVVQNVSLLYTNVLKKVVLKVIMITDLHKLA